MPANKEAFSILMQKFQAEEFLLTGNIDPGRSCTLEPLLQEAEAIKPYITAVNVTDSLGALVSMNALIVASSIQQKMDLETILQLTCRDFNRIGLASTLLGASATGIKNILIMDGDDTTLGNVPNAKPVFDLDSTQLLALGQEMVNDQTIYGLSIENSEHNPFKIHFGITANPNTDHLEAEMIKIERKIAIGADFIQTMPIFELERVIPFLTELQKFQIPVLVGVLPLKNYQTVLEKNPALGSLQIPFNLIEQLKSIQDENTDDETKKNEYDQANLDFFRPLLIELRQKGLIAGIHIMASDYSRVFPKFCEFCKEIQ